MNAWYRSWRVALRIARRDAWRYKGRSILVLAMIALPILGVSAADLTVRSAQLSTSESLTRQIGAADARVTDVDLGGVPLMQNTDPRDYTTVKDYGDTAWPSGHTDVTAALPAGARTLTDATGSGKLVTTHGLLKTDIRELDTKDPMTKGIMRLVGGHFPANVREVAASTHFLKASGLRVGSLLTARDLATKYRIVGSYELPDELDTDQVNALPGAFLAPLDKALTAKGTPPDIQTSSLLVAIRGGFTWNMVQQANQHGVTVSSRAVAFHPPAKADIPYLKREGRLFSGDDSTTAATVAATVVGLAMLEICLLAGPAFAVGARRSRRQLGLVGANGGNRRHIRAVVLGGGLVIGLASAVLGTLLGLVLTFALRPVLENALGQRFGHFDIRPVELLGIALLAVVTGLLAAIVPAITASRQTVLASLTGRRGVRRSSRVLPVLGLVGVLLGAAIALYGSTVTDQSTIVVGGSVIAELGLVALTPALVGLFGRVGRWLPLSPRLALRDAVRNRGRTAPAVAAVLAAVAGTVAVSTYAASSDAQDRAAYEPSLPHGAVVMTITDDGGRDVPAARNAVARTLPVDVRAPVDRPAIGKPGCDFYSQDPGCGGFAFVVPKANQCPLFSFDNKPPAQNLTPAQRTALFKDWRCKNSDGNIISGDVAIGDANVLAVLGIHDPAAEKALAAGRVVSFDRRNVDKQGRVGLRLFPDMAKQDAAAAQFRNGPNTVKDFAAYQMPAGTKAYGLQLLMTQATAKAAGIRTAPLGGLYTTTRMPSSAQEQKVNAALDATGSEVNFQIEKGYVSKNNIVLLALGIFAGLVTIGAAAIATGLAQTDAEADLKTLSAVGAPGRVRRTLSGFQCGVVAAMGVLLGSAAGVLPSIALRLTQRRLEQQSYEKGLATSMGNLTVPHVSIVIPWGTLVTLLIAVPVGAALLAAAVTRSQRSLSRRAAT